MSLIIWGCLAAAALVGFNHDYVIGATVSDVATELILDVTKVLSIIKLLFENISSVFSSLR